MNESRRKAFEQWWFENSSKTHNPNDIWDAACDWMKEELIWRMEQFVEKHRNEQS